MTPVASGFVAVSIVAASVFMFATTAQDNAQNHQIDQLKNDRATVQEQIAAEKARTRQLEAVVQQLLTDRAQTSASVTSVPAGPYCNLHDIAVQNPGC